MQCHTVSLPLAKPFSLRHRRTSSANQSETAYTENTLPKVKPCFARTETLEKSVDHNTTVTPSEKKFN